MRRAAAETGIPATRAYLAIGYQTASWCPYLGFHRVAGLDPVGMLVIDYGFHIPYIVAAGVVAWFFFATSTTKADVAARARQEGAPAAA